MALNTSIGLLILPNEILGDILSHLAPDVPPVLAYDPLEIPSVSTDTGLKPKDKFKVFWQQRQNDIFALQNVCRSSRRMRQLATRRLYQNVVIGDMRCLLLFLRTLIGHPLLRTHVKCLVFVDDTDQCRDHTRVLEYPSLWRDIRSSHQGTDLDCRIFQLFGGSQQFTGDPHHGTWKWSSYSKGNAGGPEFPSEHVVFGILMCLLNNLKHVAVGSTWFQNHPGDGSLPRKNLESAMTDPILRR
ncbi:hypothetical protein PG985_015049 [Apiospora marii]|uniref:F-box domain-containing protein n=1 Tax=Apiospora marii TaxID=335849 RepID=A0ABR1RJM1_9PEZI